MIPALARVVRHSRRTVSSSDSPGSGTRVARFHRPASSQTALLRRVPGMNRRLAHGVEHLALRRAAENAEGDGRIGQAEGRQPDLGDLAAERIGGDGEGVHVGGLALIGRHAGRGVALDVLDRAHALARRELDVAGGDVVLEIDEGLGRVCPRGSGATRPSVPTSNAVRALDARRLGRPRRRRLRAPRPEPRRSRKRRRQAPTETMSCAASPGTKVRVAASKRSRPRDCENRCTLGVQPPVMAMRSQAISSGLPGRPSDHSRADQRVGDPQAAARAEQRRMGLDRQALARAPPAPAGRRPPRAESTIIAIPQPASARSSAAR